MCGIAGFVRNSQVTETFASDAVNRMMIHMQKRGPDAEGIWVDSDVTLGHRRLSILDLDVRANQPMLSTDGRFVIVFNGEIYNFLELRKELEMQGEAFRTSSDTEVILALFVREGEDMLIKLRGMFAFAIWDTVSKELFMARDPYGIKPLYYTINEHGLLFASQVKALLASECVSRDIEAAGLAGFYLWGWVPEPWTLYKNIFALPAGYCARISLEQLYTPRLICWYDIRKNWQTQVSRAISANALEEIVHEEVKASVKSHMISDVPICVFLSGGIDSGIIAALVSELGAPVEGITIGFQEYAETTLDEVPLAREIANQYGMPHHVHTVTPEQFVEEIPRILAAMDQPSIDGINTWFAAKAAADRGFKVVLSGLGGDELFCGYTTFKFIPQVNRSFRLALAIPGVSAVIELLCSVMVHLGGKTKYSAVPRFMKSVEGLYFLRRTLFVPEELPLLMGEDMASEGLARLAGFPPGMKLAKCKDDIHAVGMLESTEYMRNQLLRDSDWASMGNSLELRTPLVDVQLLSRLSPYISQFANGAGKQILARTPSRPLPDSIIKRPKTGFAIPMMLWLAKKSVANVWSDVPQLKQQKNRWARRWAKILIAEMTALDSNKHSSQ